MREILFRGKRKDNGEWVYGDLLHPDTECDCGYSIEDIDKSIKNNCHEVITETVSEYTGLTDKNANKIFENDIVEYDHFLGHFRGCVVEFKNGIFYLKSMSSPQYKLYNVENIQVIGNVFDNKELDGRHTYIK